MSDSPDHYSAQTLTVSEVDLKLKCVGIIVCEPLVPIKAEYLYPQPLYLR